MYLHGDPANHMTLGERIRCWWLRRKDKKRPYIPPIGYCNRPYIPPGWQGNEKWPVKDEFTSHGAIRR